MQIDLQDRIDAAVAKVTFAPNIKFRNAAGVDVTNDVLERYRAAAKVIIAKNVEWGANRKPSAPTPKYARMRSMGWRATTKREKHLEQRRAVAA